MTTFDRQSCGRGIGGVTYLEYRDVFCYAFGIGTKYADLQQKSQAIACLRQQ